MMLFMLMFLSRLCLQKRSLQLVIGEDIERLYLSTFDGKSINILASGADISSTIACKMSNKSSLDRFFTLSNHATFGRNLTIKLKRVFFHVLGLTPIRGLQNLDNVVDGNVPLEVVLAKGPKSVIGEDK